MGGLRPRLLLYLFKSAKGQASERYEVYSFFYLLSTKNCGEWPIGVSTALVAAASLQVNKPSPVGEKQYTGLFFYSSSTKREDAVTCSFFSLY